LDPSNFGNPDNLDAVKQKSYWKNGKMERRKMNLDMTPNMEESVRWRCWENGAKSGGESLEKVEVGNDAV